MYLQYNLEDLVVPTGPNSTPIVYQESPVSLNFYTISLFFVNCPQALYVNPDLPSAGSCLTCFQGIDVSPVHKTFFTISFILYLVISYLIHLKQKRTY